MTRNTRIFLISLVILAIPAIVTAQRKPLLSVCSGEGSPANGAVLTICITEQGMRSGAQPQLMLRLFADRQAEYELSPADEDSAAESTSLTKKQFSVKAGALTEILRLGRSSDFQRAKSSYSSLIHKTDSSSRTTIEFTDHGRTKRITLSNFYGKRPANKGYYPASVLRMMEKAEEIRRTAIGAIVR